MAKFHGEIGYAISQETTPGVWTETIIEKVYYGELLQNTSRWQPTEHLNDDLNISNKISILTDPYAVANFNFIRYAKLMGSYWKVTDVEVQYPRLILSLGGVYNGPTSETTS